jgi:hypothetical protein
MRGSKRKGDERGLRKRREEKIKACLCINKNN